MATVAELYSWKSLACIPCFGFVMIMKQEAFFSESGWVRLITIFFGSDLIYGFAIQEQSISEKDQINVYPGFPDVSCCSAVDAMIDNDRMTFVGETGAKACCIAQFN